jgi:hypothetical protein
MSNATKNPAQIAASLSPYQASLVRAGARGAIDRNWGSNPSDSSDSPRTILRLRKMGLLSCARAHASRLGWPMPMGGYVATDLGRAVAAELTREILRAVNRARNVADGRDG